MNRRNPQSGVTIPEIVISVAVLIAVFVIFGTRSERYMKKARTTGANVQLRSIESRLKTHFVERMSFPIGDSGQTPSKPCCEYPNKRCPSGYSAERNPIWDELDVELQDTKFQFRYVGTRDEVTVTATGDPECDGDPVTFTMHGKIERGYPTFTVSSSGD
jgi:type II secretory pathway pseudopilin PulG